MTSVKNETHRGEISPKSETNEHDYAHSAASTEACASSGAPGADGPASHTQESFTSPAEPEPTLPVELPEPAVGAEVDCPGEPEVEDSPQPQTSGDPQKISEFSPELTVPFCTQNRRRSSARRPEDRHCCGCKREFERQGRCFSRRAVYTFTNPETVHWVFPGITVHDRSFLCEACAQLIRSKCKRKQNTKRSIWLKPPQQPKMKDKKSTERKMGKKSKAALLVSKSCYRAALKTLWSTKGAHKPMMEFWRKQLKEEMKTLTRQNDSPFQEKVSSKKPLSSFPWRRCLDWTQEKAPLVFTCLTSLFPDLNALSKSGHQLSEEQAQTLLERRAVVALSIPLFTRNVWKNNFLQASLGAELRQQGCTGSTLDALNTMGLCQNKDTVRLLLHRLRDKKTQAQNGRQRRMKQMQLKGEQMTDMEEEDIEEDEEEEEEEEEEDEDDEEEGVEEEEEDEGQIEVAVEEEVEEAEVQVEVPMAEEDDHAVEEEKKRRRKKAKKQKKEKRKERAKRKVEEQQQQQEEEAEEEDDEGSEQKKRKVVVVRLGLLKGHSEVGRSDLSAP